MGIGMTAHPHPHPSRPLPTSPLPHHRVLGLVFLCPGRVLVPVVVWTLEVVGDVK